MTTNYMWDLGFNWNANPGDDGTFFLAAGLVTWPLSNGQQGNPIQASSETTRFEIGDQVGFNLFNRTAGATPTDYSIMSPVRITFRANGGDGQTVSTPFSGAASMTLNPLPGQEGGSIGLGQPNQVFPVWSLGVFPLVTAGSFEFNILVVVNGPGGVRVYKADPEMIVGGTNQPPR